MTDVTVFGAGIFGLSVAWACQKKGARVRVIDPGGPGAGASGGVVGALEPKPIVTGVPGREPEEGFFPPRRRIGVAEARFVELPPEHGRLLADRCPIGGPVAGCLEQAPDPLGHTLAGTAQPAAARCRRVISSRCGAFVHPSGRSIASKAQNFRQ